MFCPNAVVWGDVATWVSGVGTAAAVAVAVWVFAHGEAIRRHADRRKQAELITGWIRYHSSRGMNVVNVGEDMVRRETGEVRDVVTVSIGLVNNSSGVAYDVIAEVSDDEGRIGRAVGIKAIGPGMWTVDVTLKAPVTSVNRLTLHFTDHKSVSWRRDPDGSLTEQRTKYRRPEGCWSAVLLPLAAADM